MSTSDVFYLGVYVEIEHNIERVFEPYRVCPNKHELPYGSEVKFCPECGAKIIEEQEEVSRTRDFDFDEILETKDGNGKPILDIDYDEFNVISTGKMETTWLVQNQTSGKYGRFLDEDTDYGAAPLDINSEPLINEFYRQYGDVLQLLQAHAASVTVKFGLVHWYW